MAHRRGFSRCVLSLAAVTRLRPPEVGAEEAQSSRYAADTDILLEPQEVRFIARRLRRLFSEEYRWGLCLGYGPAPGPTLTKALCRTRPSAEAYDKYRHRKWTWLPQFKSRTRMFTFPITSITKSRYSHGFIDSLSIRPYHPSLPVGPPDNIRCPRRTVVGKFLQVNQQRKGPWESVTYKFVLASPTVSRMSCSSS